ncbi:MAG: hypothetical protein Q7V14_06270, partial [Coriobacteriia bacterium]|nr:hypothetical protein [Coriobacteriia bacterium]
TRFGIAGTTWTPIPGCTTCRRGIMRIVLFCPEDLGVRTPDGIVSAKELTFGGRYADGFDVEARFSQVEGVWWIDGLTLATRGEGR